MRSPRSLFWTNRDRYGMRELVEEDDPRQAVKAIQAGEWMADERAYELGIMQYLAGGDERRARGPQPEGDDRPRLEQHAGQASGQVRQWGFDRRPFTTPSVEERSYVENAVNEPYQLSAHEREEAGALGAELTGPTRPEVADAGGHAQATERANQAMGGGSAQPPARAGEAAESPPRPASAEGSRRTKE